MSTTTSDRRYQKLLTEAYRMRTDWIQPVSILILGVLGVFFIYSAQFYSEQSYWLKQIFWFVMGVVIYTGISLLDYKILMEKAHLIYLGSILLLALLWTPLGIERFNSIRWIGIEGTPLRFQPSEAAKIGVLIMVASLLTRSKIGSLGESLTVLGKVGLIILIPIVLIFLQPDLGSAIVFPPMVFSLLYVSRLSERFFGIVFAVFIIFTGILSIDLVSYYHFYRDHNLDFYQDRGAYESHSWIPLKDYQRSRIIAFVDSEAVDPKGIGVSWNKIQSNISVGSGGITGKGWKNGTQAKLGYLPQSVAHNDFIFSVLAEEKGFLGGTAVLGFYAILLANGIRIAGTARDRFGMLLAVGVSVIFAVHIFINIGMTIGLMPITGLPLPFLSYGGSFVLSCCFLQGLIQSVNRFRRDFT